MARCSFPWTRFLALRVRVYCTRPGRSLEREWIIVPFGSSISLSETFVPAICTSASSSGTLQCPLSRMCVCTPSTVPLHAPQCMHLVYSKIRLLRCSRNKGTSQADGTKSPWAVDMCERFDSRDGEVCWQKRHCVDGGSFDSDSDSDSDPTSTSNADNRGVLFLWSDSSMLSSGAGCAVS
jgi:hypothetical protein